MTTRTDERAEFLATVMTTAVEGGIGYWSYAEDYRWGFADIGTSDGKRLEAGQQAYASVTLSDVEEDDPAFETTRVDIETIARGLRVIREGRAGIGAQLRANIMLADRTNGEEGDIDAGDADCVLQAGLFDGAVVFG